MVPPHRAREGALSIVPKAEYGKVSPMHETNLDMPLQAAEPAAVLLRRPFAVPAGVVLGSMLLAACGGGATCEAGRAEFEVQLAKIAEEWPNVPPKLRKSAEHDWSVMRSAIGLQDVAPGPTIDIASLRQTSLSEDGNACDCEAGLDLTSHPAALFVLGTYTALARKPNLVVDKVDGKPVGWYPFQVLVDTEGRTIVRHGVR